MSHSLHHDDNQDESIIKKFDINRTENVYALINEIILVKKCCEHVNILPSVSSCYKKEDELCLVSPDLKKAYNCFSVFKNGLSAKIVAYAIMETLVALNHMHVQGGRVHGYLNSKNVFFDQQATVKLAFPTWLINESNTMYPSNVDAYVKCDVKMVGLLALDLFFGESLERKYLGCIPSIVSKKLPKSLKDFIKFCDDSSRGSGPITINLLMQHEFFNKFGDFNRYKEDLKKLVRIKSSKK